MLIIIVPFLFNFYKRKVSFSNLSINFKISLYRFWSCNWECTLIENAQYFRSASRSRSNHNQNAAGSWSRCNWITAKIWSNFGWIMTATLWLDCRCVTTGSPLCSAHDRSQLWSWWKRRCNRVYDHRCHDHAWSQRETWCRQPIGFKNTNPTECLLRKKRHERDDVNRSEDESDRCTEARDKSHGIKALLTLLLSTTNRFFKKKWHQIRVDQRDTLAPSSFWNHTRHAQLFFPKGTCSLCGVLVDSSLPRVDFVLIFISWGISHPLFFCLI